MSRYLLTGDALLLSDVHHTLEHTSPIVHTDLLILSPWLTLSFRDAPTQNTID